MSEPPRIELESEIGAGATGRVWRARLCEAAGGLSSGDQVALKRLHPRLIGDAQAREAFARECEASAAVQHAGLVRFVHAGVDDVGPYLLTEYVPGKTLEAQLVEQGPLPEPLLRSVASQLAGALAALHGAGWIHGDVKPENMRVDARGRAVLLDLGFARRVRPAKTAPLPRNDETDASSASEAGDAQPIELALGSAFNPGSLAYLAPECARGEAAQQASDVFSLGVTLFELATGSHPFAADFVATVEPGATVGGGTGRAGSSTLPMVRSLEAPGADRLLAAIASARYRPASRFVPQLSPFLDHVLGEALLRDPRQRPTARELARRLDEQESGAWWRARIDAGGPSTAAALLERESPHLTPLAGREAELARISELYHAAVGDDPLAKDPAQPAPAPARGGALWLEGPVGSGKSRLMSSFAAGVRVSEQPPLYLYGRCTPHEEDRPAGAVLRLLLRWLRLPPQTTHLAARERAALERVAPPQEAETLARALDSRFAGSTRTSVVTALARWLLLLSRRAPLVVFLDDVNFADEATISVLARVAEELAGKRLFLVLGNRLHDGVSHPKALEQLVQALDSRGLSSRLVLEPLNEEAMVDLVTRLFHHSAPRLRIAQVLHERSRGNPGMVAEILRGLIERNEAYPHGGEGEAGLVLALPPERMPMPESLPTLIHQRYQKLPLEDRRWLQRLSIVGGRLSAEFLLRAFQPVSETELAGILGRMVQGGWIVPAGDRYRFARPALREAVYRAIPEDSRARLHAQAARALDPGRGKSSSLADAFQRAFHLRAAGESADLLRVLRPLLAAMVRRGQTQRVHAIASWGLEALGRLPRTKARELLRIEFLEAAADAADRLGQREEQRAWLDQLSDLALSPQTDPEALARVYLLHGRHAIATGQYGLARGFLKNAVELAERAGGAGLLVSEACRRLSAVQAHVGELDAARELALRAQKTAVHEPQLAVAHLQIAVIDLLEDELEAALGQVDRALSLLRSSHDWTLPGVLAAAHMLRGRIYRLLGRPGRAIGAMQHAVRMARQAAERRLEMEATARLGGLLLDLNRADEAEARLRHALWIANEIEDRRGQTLAGLWLGILLWEQNDPEAPRLLSRVQRMAREMGLSRAQALCLAIQSRISNARGDLEEALQDSELAMDLCERHGAELADRIVITGTRALILHSAGWHDRGADLVKGLRRRLRRESARLTKSDLREVHREASRRLLEAVLSPEGPIYPRAGPGSARAPSI